MKPTVGAVVVVGALLTFGSMAALVGSCGRATEAKMEGKSRDEVVARARAILRDKLEDLQGQVDSTECVCVIAIMADGEGKVNASVTMGGVVKQPIRFGAALAASIEQVKEGLRAMGPCDCPDCRAARAMAHAHTILRDAARASAPGSMKDN